MTTKKYHAKESADEVMTLPATKKNHAKDSTSWNHSTMRSCNRHSKLLLHQMSSLNHSLPSCRRLRSARRPPMSDEMMDRMIKNRAKSKLTRPQLTQTTNRGIRQNAGEMMIEMAKKNISWNRWTMRSCYRHNSSLLRHTCCLNHSLLSCHRQGSARRPPMSDEMMDRMIKNHAKSKLTRPRLTRTAIWRIRQNADEAMT